MEQQRQQAMTRQHSQREPKEVPDEDAALWRQQQWREHQQPSSSRPSQRPDSRRHHQQPQQQQGNHASALQHERTQRRQQQQQQQQQGRPAAPQQQPSRHHRRRQQQPPPPPHDLGRASTDTVVLAARAAALGIHPLPTPPGSPAASPPGMAPSPADIGGEIPRLCSTSLADLDAPLSQQARWPQQPQQQQAAGRRQQPDWPCRRAGRTQPAAESADAPPPTRPRSDPDLHCRGVWQCPEWLLPMPLLAWSGTAAWEGGSNRREVWVVCVLSCRSVRAALPPRDTC